MRDLVRWLVVLADEENVSAAADLLGIPQPTLSRRLSRLESDLGATLFDRHGRRISLNDKGRAFVEQVRVADAALARLDGDDVADGAEVLDAFEQNDLHLTSPRTAGGPDSGRA